MLIFDTTTCVI